MSQRVITVSAAPNASELVTDAFQAAFDAARDVAGARVVVPAGTYRVGSLRMYGDTELYLESDAHIQGSADIADYTDWDIPTTLAYVTDPEIVRIQSIPAHYVKALLTVADADNVSIVGEPGSSFDGVDCTDPAGEEGFRGAMGIRICRCRNVTLRGYTFKRSANWSHQMDSCENLLVKDVTILGGHDGFNIHHCTNVSIKDCTIKTGDDCVAGFDARNVSVENCLLNTACNAIRLGCANLFVARCRFVGPGEYPHILDGKFHMHAAIKYYSPAGDSYRGDACGWRFADCTFENPGRMFNYDFGSERGYMTERPLVDVHLERCNVTGASMTSFFSGSSEVPGTLELKDCSVEYVPDAESAGKPFVQLGEGAELDCNQVEYVCPSGEPMEGVRTVEASEVIAEVLKKVD